MHKRHYHAKKIQGNFGNSWQRRGWHIPKSRKEEWKACLETMSGLSAGGSACSRCSRSSARLGKADAP